MSIFKNNPPNPNLQQSNFDMTHNILVTSNLGELLPIDTDDVIPNDFWKKSYNCVVKVAPMMAPAFTLLNGYLNSYYVPFQQIWKYWNNFVTNRPSDTFTSSSNSSKYDNVYKVPKIHTQLIQMICKIAAGNFDVILQGNSLQFQFFSSNSAFNTYDSKMPTKRVINFTVNTAYNLQTVQYEDSEISNLFHKDVPYSLVNQSYTPTNYTFKVSMDNTSLAEYKVHGFFDILSFFMDRVIKCTKLFDYFGIPVEILALKPFEDYADEYINALPFMAYSKIWNDHYRDKQLQSPDLSYCLANGSMFNIAYTKLDSTAVPASGWTLELDDYPPNAQSTQHQIETFFKIDTLEKAFMVLTGCGIEKYLHKFNDEYSQQGTSTLSIPHYYNGLATLKFRNFGNDYFTSALLDPLAGAKNIEVPDTITELRSANKLQEFLERSAWSRDIYNFFKTHFGSTPKTVEYHTPLLLGTSKVQINIGEQLQTSESSSSSPLGSRAGIAEGFGNGNTVFKKFDDHGIIITLLSTTMKNQYYQGLRKSLTPPESYLDLPFPEFANLGNEAIYQREIYYGKYHKTNVGELYFNNQQGTIKDNATIEEYTNYLGEVTSIKSPNALAPEDKSDVKLDDVFGYISRYASQKFRLDEVHGEFRNTLQFWHTARQFAAPPVLGHSFITYEYAPIFNNIYRIFAVEEDYTDHFYYDIFSNSSVTRSLPYISNPHF